MQVCARRKDNEASGNVRTVDIYKYKNGVLFKFFLTWSISHTFWADGASVPLQMRKVYQGSAITPRNMDKLMLFRDPGEENDIAIINHSNSQEF